MKAKKSLLLGAVAFLGLAATGVVSTPAVMAEAEDVHATSVLVRNRDSLMWGGGDYGKAVAVTLPGQDFSVWAAGYSLTNVTPDLAFEIYDEYGVMSEFGRNSSGIFPFGDSILISFNNINRHGDILHIPSGISFTSSNAPNEGKTFIFDNESWWICKLADGAGGEWEQLIRPTVFEFTQEEADLDLNAELDLTTVLTNTTTDDDPLVFYKSSNDAVAKVDANGKVTAAGEGTATITAYSAMETAEITVNVTIPAAQTGIKVISPEDGKITTYVGVEPDWSKIQLAATYDDGSEGAISWTPGEDTIGDYNPTQIGDQAVTITVNGFSTTVTLTIQEVTAELKPNLASFGVNSGWGGIFYMDWDGVAITQSFNLYDEALKNVLDHIVIEGPSGKVTDVKFLQAARYILYSNGDDKILPTDWKIGDSVSFTPGMYQWSYTGTIDAGSQNPNGDGDWVPVAVLKEGIKWVYNGSSFVLSDSKPTDFTLEYEDDIVRVGDTLDASFAFDPATSGATPEFVSSDPTVLSVDRYGNVTGLKAGKATVTATVEGTTGGDTPEAKTITKTFDFEVVDLDIVGVKPYTGWEVNHQVYVGQDLTNWNPSIPYFHLILEGDVEYMKNFDAASFTYTIDKTFDHSKVGDVTASMSVTYDEQNYTTTLPVTVYELYDQEITTASIVSWFSFWIFADAPNTASNDPNISNEAGTAWTDANMLQHVHYTRADGTEVPIKTIYMLGHNVAIEPSFLDAGCNDTNYGNSDYYKLDDMLTIDAGMPIPKFTGSKIGSADPSNPDGMDLSTGEIIIDGYTTETVQYRFDGTSLVRYKEATGLKATQTTIELEVGQNALAGVEKDPVDATTGTITYTSSDPNVATVSEAGIISGVGVGTCTITASMTLEDGTVSTVTITVNVKAAPSSEPTEPTEPPASTGLTPGQIGGIVGGVCGGIVVIGVVVFLVLHFKKKKQ